MLTFIAVVALACSFAFLMLAIFGVGKHKEEPEFWVAQVAHRRVEAERRR